MPNGNPTRKKRELRPATITMHWFCLVSLLKGTHNNKDIHHEAANFLMCRLMILHAPLGIRCYFSFLFLQIVMWGVGGHQFGSNCKQSIWWQIPSLPRNVTNRSTSKTNPWENRLGAFRCYCDHEKHGRSTAGLAYFFQNPWPKGACVNCSRSPWPTCCGSWRVWLCLVQNNPLPPIHIKHSHSMAPICPNYVEVPYQMVFGGGV